MPMRGEPFTEAKLRVTHGVEIREGMFLVTSGGSAYRVERVAGATLDCLRWPRDEVPADAEVVEWEWDHRHVRSVTVTRRD